MSDCQLNTIPGSVGFAIINVKNQPPRHANANTSEVQHELTAKTRPQQYRTSLRWEFWTDIAITHAFGWGRLLVKTDAATCSDSLLDWLNHHTSHNSDCISPGTALLSHIVPGFRVGLTGVPIPAGKTSPETVWHPPNLNGHGALSFPMGKAAVAWD
jgi:hypothetical protein